MKNKKIIFYVTGQYMRQNKKRTITTWLGIVGIVVLMTCVFVGKDTVFSYLERIAEQKSGKWHVSVYGIDRKQYQKICSLNYIGQTAVSYDYGFSDFKESGNKNKPFFLVKGYSEPCFDWMNIKLAEGRFPQNERELIISENALSDGAPLHIGDKVSVDCFWRSVRVKKGEKQHIIFPFYHVSIDVGDEIKVPQGFPYYEENDDFEEIHEKTGEQAEYTVVGFMEPAYYETEEGAFYTALTCVPNSMSDKKKVNISARFSDEKVPGDYARQLAGIISGVSVSKGEELTEDVSTALNEGSKSVETNDLLLTFSANTSDGSLNILVKFIVCFFVFLILIISVVLIYNVFNISFEERCRYLGILSSVGATRRQKKSSVYYEALILLMFALPIGFFVGIGIVKAGMLFLRPYLSRMLEWRTAAEYLPVKTELMLTGQNVLMVVVIATVTVLVSCYLPAKKISKISPIESIRGTEELKRKRRKGLSGKKCKRPEWMLAMRNLNLHKRKTRSIVRAAAVFMLIVIVTSYGANAVTKMVHYRLVEDNSVQFNMDSYDYVLEECHGFGQTYHAMKEEILRNPSVTEVKEWSTGMFAGQIQNQVLSQEYWNAYRTIAGEYDADEFTDREFDELISGNSNIASVYAVDDDTYRDIAKKSQCDSTIAGNTEVPNAIFYQNLELTTDNLRFEGGKAKKYLFFELERATDLPIGEEFALSVFNEKKDAMEEFPLVMAGYATKDSIKDYMTFHGENICLIISQSTAEKLNRVMMKTESLDEDGNYSTLERQLYIRLADPNCALAQKLAQISDENNDMEEAHFVLFSMNMTEILETVAQTINFLIDVVAVCFVLFSSLICLLNLFNSVRARAEMRKREMAMLRSVGMVQSQIKRMLFYENIGLILRGFLWTVVFSVPMLYGIWRVIQTYFGRMKQGFPWYLYAVALLIVTVSLMAVTAYCYRKKEKENILEELRRDI